MRIAHGPLLLSMLGLIQTAAGSAPFDIRAAAEFAKIVPEGAKVEKLAGGMRFTEGPVWIPDGGYLVFSDIPANELKKWSPKGGLEVFRSPSRNANGNILDRQGRLISCEHGSRRVTRTEKDGTVTTLAERFGGKRLNSPNDATVGPDGVIWFTDPPYGLKGQKEGKELETQNVFRLDPETGDLRAVATDFSRPNGICLSPDATRLYVADSDRSLHHIRVFEVKADGTLANGRIFCNIDVRSPDGIRCDADGRVWSSAGDGVQIFAPDGSLIGKILVPEGPSNLCFGGPDGKRLFITARKSLYAIRVGVKGAP